MAIPVHSAEERWEAAATAAKLLQSCPTLCDPRDSSPPGSPVPGILQARTLEWVAINQTSKTHLGGPHRSTGKKRYGLAFPGGPVVKNLPTNAGDMGSIPGPGRSHMQWSN